MDIECVQRVIGGSGISGHSCERDVMPDGLRNFGVFVLRVVDLFRYHSPYEKSGLFTDGMVPYGSVGSGSNLSCTPIVGFSPSLPLKRALIVEPIQVRVANWPPGPNLD